MNTVWIVQYDDGGDHRIIDVYATRELADAKIANLELHYSYNKGNYIAEPWDVRNKPDTNGGK